MNKNEYPDDVADFESVVGVDQTLEQLGQSAMLADVVLQSGHAVIADDEPQFQGAEAARQRNAPMLFE